MDLEYALQLVKANGNRIQMVDDPTEEIRNAAIMRTPSAIQYIPDATVEEKQLAIEIQGQNDRDGIFDLVEMITGIDDSLLDYALNYNGECIKLIEQPSTNQINRAVTLDGDAIRFIENPTVDIQLISIGHDLDNLCHIKNPDYDVVTKALADNPCVIEHVDKPHKDHQLYVLKELPESGLHYINEVDEDIAFDHIKQYPEQIGLLNNQFEEVCWLALNSDGSLIKYIRNPTPEMESYARIVSDGS